MNSLGVVFIALISFWLGYRFYARRLERIFEVDEKRPTPAYTKSDGADFVPAKNWLVLFGHHFASIAGAGPIIGPVIAAVLWGWLPALAWIVLGSIFIGGVHDFSALIISVRQQGRSIADIAQDAISKKARIIFSAFVLLALILVIAVFVYFCAKTFVEEPKIILPSLGLIPVAMIVGFLIYHRDRKLIIATAFGLISLFALLIWGQILPIKMPGNPIVFWSIILLIYCFFASVLPVNILLQPRDYLSSFLLFFTVALGYCGIFFLRPQILQPALVSIKSSEGLLWPMMFVTVACGAISGFHALIASGTSSKQIASEAHAKRISYGAMLAEGLVAVLAVVCVVSISSFDRTSNLSKMLKDLGPVGIFTKGFGFISQGIAGKFGAFLAILTLNAFILTTLDTAARIARYILEELTPIKNKYLSTLIILIASAFLALSGQWNKIWPAFGASNQLVAALTFLVVTCWLLARKKKVGFVLIPAIIMLTTTLAALVIGIFNYWRSRDLFLMIISLILIILALVLTAEVVKTGKRLKETRR